MPASGVPESKPEELRLNPLGKALPVLLKVKVVGNPLAVSWKVVPATVAVKVLLFALVITGG